MHCGLGQLNVTGNLFLGLTIHITFGYTRSIFFPERCPEFASISFVLFNNFSLSMLVKVYALKKKEKIEPEEVNEPFVCSECRNQSLKPCLCICVMNFLYISPPCLVMQLTWQAFRGHFKLFIYLRL